MFGEAKAAIQKKINEKFKDIKKKIFNLFGLVGADNEEEDEEKRITILVNNDGEVQEKDFIAKD